MRELRPPRFYSGDFVVDERDSPPSAEEFRQKYLEPMRPLVLRNAYDWEIFRKWTPAYIIEQLEGVNYSLRTTDEDGSENVESYDLGRYTSCLVDGLIGVSNAYAAQFEIPAVLQPDVCWPEFVPDEPIRLVDFMWIGGNKNTTKLHFDMTPNFAVMVRGEKSFELFSPAFHSLDANSSQHSGGGIFTAVDPDNPDTLAFPGSSYVSSARVTLRSGDMLFLPPRWWHRVENVEPSVMLNRWWRSPLECFLDHSWLFSQKGFIRALIENADFSGFDSDLEVAQALCDAKTEHLASAVCVYWCAHCLAELDATSDAKTASLLEQVGQIKSIMEIASDLYFAEPNLGTASADERRERVGKLRRLNIPQYLASLRDLHARLPPVSRLFDNERGNLITSSAFTDESGDADVDQHTAHHEDEASDAPDEEGIEEVRPHDRLSLAQGKALVSELKSSTGEATTRLHLLGVVIDFSEAGWDVFAHRISTGEPFLAGDVEQWVSTQSKVWTWPDIQEKLSLLTHMGHLIRD